METAIESSSGREELTITPVSITDSFTDMLQEDMYEQGVLAAPKERSKPICEVCNKEFKDNFKLKRHLLVHTGEKPYACDLCDVRFSRKEGVERHMLREHKGIESHKCPKCPKEYLSKTSLEDHIKTHEDKDPGPDGPPFNCEICQKSFSTRKNRNKHRIIHKDINERKIYPCDMCDAAFVSHGNLLTHQTVHTGIRPYVCEICNKTFAENSKLKRHIAIHSEIRAYSCNLCEKAFRTSDSLNRHRRIHTGEGFPCDICGAVFSERYKLQRHIETHMNKVAETCTLCGKFFNSSKMFAKHLEIHERKGHTYMPGNYINNDDASNSILEDLCEVDTSVEIDEDSYMEREGEVIVSDGGDGENVEEGFIDCGNFFQAEMVEGGNDDNRSEDEEPISVDPQPDESFQYNLEDNDNAQDCIIEGEEAHENYYNGAAIDRNIGRFPCTDCDKVFTLNKSLTRHRRIHTGDVFTCYICKHVFTERYKLKKHFLSVHNKKVNTCVVCNKELTSMQVYSKHMRNHFNRGELGSEAYQELLDNKEILPPDHDSDLVDAKSEDKEFPAVSLSDSLPHSLDDSLSSNVPESFPDMLTQVMYEQGVLTKSSPNKKRSLVSKTCEICNKVFRDSFKLKRHMHVHTGEKPYACDFCNLRFSRKEGLVRHKVIHTEGNMPKVKLLKHCDVCDRTLQSMHVYSKHMKNHLTRGEMGLSNYQELLDNNEINPMDDSVSNGHTSTADANEFAEAHRDFIATADEQIPSGQNDRVNVMVKQETDQQPDFVNYGNNASVVITSVEIKQEASNLNFLEQESGITPSLDFHPYVQSSLAASQLQNLVSEDIGGFPKRKRKKKIGNFSCTHCEKQFKYNDSLTKHMRLHTGNVYSCDLCDKVFTENSHLNRHRETHTNKIDKACPLCNHPFKSLLVYNKHMRNHEDKGQIELEFDPEGVLVGKPVKLKLVNLNSSTPGVEGAESIDIKPVKSRRPRRPAENMLAMTKMQMRLLNQQPNKKTFTCEACDKVFLKRNSLYNHMKLHTGNTLSCPFCPGIFTENYKLKRHLKIHERRGGQLTGHSLEQSQDDEDNSFEPEDPSSETFLQYDDIEYNNEEEDNDYIINDIKNPLIQNNESAGEEMDMDNNESSNDEYNNEEEDNDYIINDIENPLIQNNESAGEEMDMDNNESSNDGEVDDYSEVHNVDDGIVIIKEEIKEYE